MPLNPSLLLSNLISLLEFIHQNLSIVNYSFDSEELCKGIQQLWAIETIMNSALKRSYEGLSIF